MLCILKMRQRVDGIVSIAKLCEVPVIAKMKKIDAPR